MSAETSRGGAKRGRADQSESTNTPKHSTLEPVRALEFYCGVGGLHYSLRRARPFGGAVRLLAAQTLLKCAQFERAALLFLSALHESVRVVAGVWEDE